MRQDASNTNCAQDSLVAYYRNLNFNPVHIPVENPAVWKSHVEKRRELYERHLGLPLHYLRGAEVLEFGPNSGENALVLAAHGARLTLVEPNSQSIPRLLDLFERFGLKGQIEAIHCAGVEDFSSDRLFDLVLAEGFLYTLPNRTEVLQRIVSFIKQGCFGVVSYNDRLGGFLEYLRRVLLFRACELASVSDTQSDACLELARGLYGADFARLKASRTFEAWWRDTLVNPFCRSQHTWSLPELVDILYREGCEFYSSSPKWSTANMYRWYKDVPTSDEHRQLVTQDWRNSFPYFLTGLRPQSGWPTVSAAVLEDVANLVTTVCDRELNAQSEHAPVAYPQSLYDCFQASADGRLLQLNMEWPKLLAALAGRDLLKLQQSYVDAKQTRSLWGTAYHYLSYQRLCDPST